MPDELLQTASETKTPSLPKYRTPTGGWRIVSVGFPFGALALNAIQIFHLLPSGIVLYTSSYLYLLLAFLLPVAFLWIPISSKASRQIVPWYDIVLAVFSAAIPIYFVSQQQAIAMKGWDQGAPLAPFLASVILWILLLEVARRAAGSVLFIILLVFSMYPFLSPYLPGFLWSPPFSLNNVVSFHTFGGDSLMGIIMRVFGSLIFPYMLFGAVIQTLGTGQFFNDLCMTFLGKARASNAKVAVVASGLFGMVSGSPISNIMTVGSFTIPAMKKEGFPAHFASAIEACASSGGVIMPPVMGATAFIMAEYLQVSYVDVCIAAFVPAVLYYMTLYAQIDSYAGRINLRPAVVTFEAPPVGKILLDYLHVLAGFVVLIVVLFVWRLPSQAPWISIAVMIILSMFRKKTRLSPKQYVAMVESAGKVIAELLSVLGPIGLIVGSLVLTGVAYSFPNIIVGLAGGNALLLLMMGAVASFIMGMGVPVSACYIFLAIVLAPALANSGLNVMGIHMFIFYWAILANITPPVALAAFTAASVGGADPMRTGYTAMMLGVAKYILPFVFVFEPALILDGSVLNIVVTVSTATVGFVIISGALEGYFWWVGNLTIVSRALLFGVGMLLVLPSFTLSACGIGAFAVVFPLLRQLRGRKNLLAKTFLKPSLEA